MGAKNCAVCGCGTDAPTCPRCGEASWLADADDDKTASQPKASKRGRMSAPPKPTTAAEDAADDKEN